MLDSLTWLREHRSARLAIPAIIGLVALPAWLLETSSPYGGFIKRIAIDPRGDLKTWFVALFVGAIILAICALILCIGLARALAAQRAQPGGRLDNHRHRERGRADFDRFTANVRTILNRLDRRPNCELEMTSITIRVFENGDVEYRREHKLSANNEKTVFCAFHEESDASAPPAPYFSDVGLTARSLDANTDVILLPMENSSHRKEFALCFIPPLSKGQIRTVEICHKWPRYCADLMEAGRTKFFWQTLTLKPNGKMNVFVELQFPQSLGQVECEIAGGAGPRATLERESTPHGGSVWRFRDSQFPRGSGELAFECSLPSAAT